MRAFGAIISVGVHGESPLPFNGRQAYNKNVSLDFGRCPARAMFPPAFDLLGERLPKPDALFVLTDLLQ